MSSLALRALTPSDAAPVAELIRRAFAHQSSTTDPPSSALKETSETIAAAIAAGGGACAEADGVPVASVLWQEKDGGLYFGRLAVDPAWRGQGLARALVAAAEAEARRRGLPRIHCGARLALTGNRRLFASLGYRETGVSAHPGYATPTMVALEKMLAPAGEMETAP
ncbi:MAG: GNAT family N-acetyltransferase [Proteobacteria bacterium]|nr:GNAT family N-acetyltransferase [Pseudomonadota bacterium]